VEVAIARLQPMLGRRRPGSRPGLYRYGRRSGLVVEAVQSQELIELIEDRLTPGE